jgi:O-antigen/teichoic acid export membrane protein
LTAALVGFQLQDWQRRYYFVRENARAAFFNDTLSYGGQVALLLLASFGDYLNVASAFWIVAITTMTAFIIGIANDRLLPMFTHARAVLNEGWRAGRDYLAAWQFQLLGTQGVFMIGAGAAGTQAVGGVRATQNIVGPINILFQAMENLIPIKAARHYATSGIPGLKRFLWRLTLLGTALLVPVLLLLSIFATPLIHALYGEKYLAFVSLVYWQALYVFIQFYQRQTFFFLRTIKATGVILRASILIAILSLVVAALTVHRFHEVGIMMALLSGSGGGLLYALAEARKLTRAMSAPVHPHVSAVHQFQHPHQCQEQT